MSQALDHGETSLPAEEWRPVVLIVDDEEDILISLEGALETALPDLTVLTAASGRKALEILGREHVDLILTDYRMPVMDGLTFLEEARKSAPLTGRMMITAYPDLDLAVRALNEARILNFIVKPAERADVVSVIGGYLEDRRKGLTQEQEIAKAFERLRTLRRKL